jgi:hypothetical protein
MKQSTTNVQIIPLKATPSQTLSVTLGGQLCKIAVYQKSTGLFMDLSVNGVALFTAQICRDRVAMLRKPYLQFTGELFFKDTQGASDPVFSGLGSRFILGYMTPI